MVLFEYHDYRKFIRFQLSQRPRKGRGEITKIADQLGVHPTLISQILSDQKHLSSEQAFDLCSYFALNPLETEYFMILVKFDRAGNPRLKTYYKEQLGQLRNRSLDISQRIDQEKVLTDQQRAVFYSSWLFSAIRLFCSLKEQGQTIDDICTRFDLSRKKASTLMNFLTATNLCLNTGVTFKMGPQRTHLDSESPYLVRHHSNWRLQALQRSEDLEKSEMMFTAPLSISKKDFQEVREELAQFIQRLSQRIKGTKPDELACLNLDFFWLK